VIKLPKLHIRTIRRQCSQLNAMPYFLGIQPNVLIMPDGSAVMNDFFKCHAYYNWLDATCGIKQSYGRTSNTDHNLGCRPRPDSCAATRRNTLLTFTAMKYQPKTSSISEISSFGINKYSHQFIFECIPILSICIKFSKPSAP